MTAVTAVAAVTLVEKLLLAALGLEDAGQSPFSVESLVMAAWHKFPRDFGLRGYVDQSADSKKVSAILAKNDGPVRDHRPRRQWLAKKGQCLYALTRAGRMELHRLSNGHDDSEPATNGHASAPVTLSAEQEELLRKLLGSTALDKHKQGRLAELCFRDACLFWGLSDALHGAQVNARLDQVGSGIEALKKQVGHGSATLSDGLSVSAADLVTLDELHECLEKRFSSHIALLSNRSGKATAGKL